MYHDRLIHYINNHQTEIINTLCDFVKIESISDNGTKVREALEFALDIGRSFGFEVKTCSDGQVGVVETGEGAETMGILAHVDVVDPGDMRKWRTKPFEPVIMDEKIFGRGTLDDKGAIIASLYAMKAVCELGEPFRKKVQLILGTQEEVRWVDMEAYVKQYPLPDYGFTPDGEFPLCNIEKGCMDLLLEFPLDKAPGEGGFLSFIDSGTAKNIVPGLCTAGITGGEGSEHLQVIKAYGKSVHSCMPEKGENAILKMAEQLSLMELKKNKLLDLIHMVRDKLGDIYGSGIGIRSESEYYNGEFVHRNVLAPTIFRVQDGIAKINVNIRTAFGTKEADVVKAFENLAAGYGGVVSGVDALPAVYVSKDRPFVQALGEAYEEVSGLKNEFALAYGGSYAKAMPNIVSWGPIFPGEDDTCHEENEYISVKSLMDNAKIFSMAIRKIVLSGKSFR